MAWDDKQIEHEIDQWTNSVIEIGLTDRDRQTDRQMVICPSPSLYYLTESPSVNLSGCLCLTRWFRGRQADRQLEICPSPPLYLSHSIAVCKSICLSDSLKQRDRHMETDCLSKNCQSFWLADRERQTDGDTPTDRLRFVRLCIYLALSLWASLSVCLSSGVTDCLHKESLWRQMCVCDYARYIHCL